MSDGNLKEVYHSLTRIIGIFAGHYQSLVFDKKAEVYYIGDAIDRLREINKAVSEEIDRRAYGSKM